MPTPDGSALVFANNDLHSSVDPAGRYSISGIPDGQKRRVYVATPTTREQPTAVLLDSIDITSAFESTPQNTRRTPLPAIVPPRGE